MQKIILYFWSFTLLLALFNVEHAWPQEQQLAQNIEIHEGFVTRLSSNILLDAYPQSPPEPVLERIPLQSDVGTVWLPGYWAWSDERGGFIWISGVWRRPPPAHTWIAGFWSQFEDGWVWIPGFWSGKEKEDLVYIDKAPPDVIGEDINSLPGEEHFWNPGYWRLKPDSKEYEWVQGSWVRLDPNWVLIPARYTWRPEGYVFIPSYWDWPLDSLGQAYESVYIDPSLRENYIYEPINPISGTYLIEQCFYYYPDYLCFYYHHFYYHPHFWKNFCCTPHWWLWDSWWTLSWDQHWGLWWWYSHPGYPAPIWMTDQIIVSLPEPPHALFAKMRDVIPPKFITPKGIVSPENLLNEAQKISKQKKPIIPSGRGKWEKIMDSVNPQKGRGDLRPKGNAKGFAPGIKERVPYNPIREKDRNRDIPFAPESRIPPIPQKPLKPKDVDQSPGRQPPIKRIPPRRGIDAERPVFQPPSSKPPIRPKPQVKPPELRPQTKPKTEKTPEISNPPFRPQYDDLPSSFQQPRPQKPITQPSSRGPRKPITPQVQQKTPQIRRQTQPPKQASPEKKAEVYQKALPQSQAGQKVPSPPPQVRPQLRQGGPSERQKPEDKWRDEKK